MKQLEKLKNIVTILFITMFSMTLTACPDGDHSEEEVDDQVVEIYDEPCLAFGSSVEYIKSYMSSYVLYNEYNNGADAEGNTSSSLFYIGKKQEKYVAYFFENGELTTSYVYIPVKYKKELNKFLASKYTEWTVTSGNFESAWVSKDNKTFIAVQKMTEDDNDYYVVLYQEK